MPEAGQARVVDGQQSAARNCGAVHRERLESAARKVSLQDQSVMAGAENDAIKAHREICTMRISYIKALVGAQTATDRTEARPRTVQCSPSPKPRDLHGYATARSRRDADRKDPRAPQALCLATPLATGSIRDNSDVRCVR